MQLTPYQAQGEVAVSQLWELYQVEPPVAV